MEQENYENPEIILEDTPDLKIIDWVGEYIILTQRVEAKKAHSRRSEFENIVLIQNCTRIMPNDPEYLVVSRERDRYGLTIAMEAHESKVNQLKEMLGEAA